MLFYVYDALFILGFLFSVLVPNIRTLRLVVCPGIVKKAIWDEMVWCQRHIAHHIVIEAFTKQHMIVIYTCTCIRYNSKPRNDIPVDYMVIRQWHKIIYFWSTVPQSSSVGSDMLGVCLTISIPAGLFQWKVIASAESQFTTIVWPLSDSDVAVCISCLLHKSNSIEWQRIGVRSDWSSSLLHLQYKSI